MTAIRDTIKNFLAADTTLMATLTGGLYTATEISRQLTPSAFDANDEVLPCALMVLEAEDPVGPYTTSSRLFVVVYFYERAGYTAIDAARDRVFALLNMQRISGSGMWEMRHVGDVPDQRDAALNCALGLSRYQVTRLR
jgi:hypothetical protein